MVAAVLLGVFAPALRSLLAELGYLALSEKELSQEILVESKSFLGDLSVKDYQHVPAFLSSHLIPVFEVLEEVQSRLDRALDSPAQLEPVQVATQLAKDLAALASDARERALGFRHRHFRGILHEFSLRFEELAAPAQRLATGDSTSKTRPKEELELIQSKLSQIAYSLAGLALHLDRQVDQRARSMQLHKLFVEALDQRSLSKLIDFETPYFNLPPKYAEQKEQEILAYLNVNHRDPSAILGLVSLYLEMRNIADASFLYGALLANRALPKELETLRAIVEESLRAYREENVEASLLKAEIRTRDDLFAEITEQYQVADARPDMNVLVLLPHEPRHIYLRSLTTQTGEELPLPAVRRT